MTVEIYTDGAASPNPGPGGYGVIVVKDAKRTELSGGFRKTTNNRMELRAAIEGLRALQENGLAVTIYSDSRYVVDMFNGGYAARWRANGWMRNRKDRAENTDLWGQLLDLCGRHRVTFAWVKGHSAHAENERCDRLAVEARRRDDLPPDGEYEKAGLAEQEQTLFDYAADAAGGEGVRTPAYLWFDTEFTGLDAENARLLQVALVITDARLNRLTPAGRDLCLNIRLEPDVPVSAWVAENLAGLLMQCRSGDAVSVEEADRRLAQRVDETVGPVVSEIKRRPILAGNTVHMDAALARRFLPEFSRRLHYRLLDVSTLKILWNDWFGGPAFDKSDDSRIRRCLPAGFDAPAAHAHDAYYDIHASLAELNYYRGRLGYRAP